MKIKVNIIYCIETLPSNSIRFQRRLRVSDSEGYHCDTPESLKFILKELYNKYNMEPESASKEEISLGYQIKITVKNALCEIHKEKISSKICEMTNFAAAVGEDNAETLENDEFTSFIRWNPKKFKWGSVPEIMAANPPFEFVKFIRQAEKAKNKYNELFSVIGEKNAKVAEK